jgi:glycosyltransferase involved in cell wall biosynthesis
MAFKPPDGGAAENVLQLARGLGDRGWEVELAGPLESSIYDQVAADVRVHRLPISPGYASLRSNGAALRGLLEILAEGRFDLVHAHSAQAGVLARAARLTGGPPVVYTPHCFTFLGHPSRLRSGVGLAIERALASRTAAFIDVSSYERASALRVRVGAPEQHHLVRNGSGPCEDSDADPELLAFRGAGPLITVVASLRPQKRVDVFLRALPRILREVPEARAAVIGNGPESEPLRQLAAQIGLDRDPRLLIAPFHGPASRYLNCSDLYVLPSGWESLPIGVLEALACGVPQVATDVGGVSEAVGVDTGVTVPPLNPGALAAAVVGLLRDPQRRARMAAASRERHHGQFGLPRMIDETIDVYEHVLAGRSAEVHAIAPLHKARV